MTAHSNDQAANLVKGEEFCRRAHAMGADIALFPEMWNIGYAPYSPEDQAGEEYDLWKAPERWNTETASSYSALQNAREQWQITQLHRRMDIL